MRNNSEEAKNIDADNEDHDFSSIAKIFCEVRMTECQISVQITFSQKDTKFTDSTKHPKI